jgi:hypothetical protein
VVVSRESLKWRQHREIGSSDLDRPRHPFRFERTNTGHACSTAEPSEMRPLLVGALFAAILALASAASAYEAVRAPMTTSTGHILG